MNRLDLIEYYESTPYINQLEEDIRIRMERLTKITPAYTENFGGKIAFDKIGEGVAELIDQEQHILELLKERNLKRKRVYKAVLDMDNTYYYATILFFRYLAEKPLKLREIYEKEILPKSSKLPIAKIVTKPSYILALISILIISDFSLNLLLKKE